MRQHVICSDAGVVTVELSQSAISDIAVVSLKDTRRLLLDSKHRWPKDKEEHRINKKLIEACELLIREWYRTSKEPLE